MGAEAAAAPTTAEPEVLSSDDVGELVQPLPEVNKAAIAAEHAPQPAAVPGEEAKPEPAPAPAAQTAKPQSTGAAKPPPSQPAAVDMFGRPFDPRVHETDAKGGPVFNTYGKRAGKLKCRRTPLREYTSTSTIGDGVAAPDAGVAGEAAPAQAAAPELDPEAVALQRKAAAATLTGLQLVLMRMALGPEIGEPQDQRDALTQSWESVLAYHDVRAFNPWIALAICTGGVVVANMHKPETRSRFHQLTAWAKVKAYALWLKITGRKPKPEPGAKADAKPDAKEPPAAAAA